MRWCAW